MLQGAGISYNCRICQRNPSFWKVGGRPSVTADNLTENDRLLPSPQQPQVCSEYGLMHQQAKVPPTQPKYPQSRKGTTKNRGQNVHKMINHSGVRSMS